MVITWWTVVVAVELVRSGLTSEFFMGDIGLVID